MAEVQSLVVAFNDWAKSINARLAPDVKFEMGGDQHAAWLYMIRPETMGRIAIYSDGKHEYHFEDAVTGEISGFVYGEAIEPSQFEKVFLPITKIYIAQKI